MSWFAWSRILQHHAAYKRNRSEKGDGCIGIKYCKLTIDGFPEACWDFRVDRISARMVRYEQMAAGFCLSYRYIMVDFRDGGSYGNCYCFIYYQLPGN